jgi:preprotein translocase subunit Sss1
MQKVIKFVLVVLLAVGAVGFVSSASADPGTGYGGGAKACTKC